MDRELQQLIRKADERRSIHYRTYRIDIVRHERGLKYRGTVNGTSIRAVAGNDWERIAERLKDRISEYIKYHGLNRLSVDLRNLP